MIVEIADRLKSVKEYYFSRKLKEIAFLIEQGVSIINLGIGKPDLIPDIKVIERLKIELDDVTAHGYQSYKGIPELRDSISQFYKRNFIVDCDPSSEVLPLIGSKEGIMHISMAFLNPGDEVLIPNPGYPTYAGAAKLAGAKTISYNLLDENQFQINLDELEDLVSEKTKLLWLNYPHMPTGTKADVAKLEKLIFWAKARKILIVNDAPYSFILNDKPFSLLSLKGAKEVCVELNSLSKSHGMSGWRLGMAIGGKQYIDAILRFKSNMDSGMFRPIQHAAITAMELDTQYFEINNKIYRERRDVIWNLLDQLDFHYIKDSAGLFVWSKVSKPFKNGEELSDFLLSEAGVFVPPGIIFGSNGNQYVRWSLCQPKEIIESACTRILTSLNK